MSEKPLKTGTEELILDAAKKVFTNKGLSGARMQEIADEAKINKSLLHYYYRSKEKLFAAVFKVVLNNFLPKGLKILNSDESLFTKIKVFSKEYVNLLMKNPYLPLFILNEINKNPKGIAGSIFNMVQNLDFNVIDKFKSDVKTEIEEGTIKEDTKAEHLFVNILSMCIFPFVGRPLIQKVGFENDTDKYDKFLKERTNEVSNFIINSIKK